ncbi:hypothetical protein VCJ_001155 [Vibrio metoecus]|nr:hypothetical protein VCJ_001155 [Vibrio metoecus]
MLLIVFAISKKERSIMLGHPECIKETQQYAILALFTPNNY